MTSITPAYARAYHERVLLNNFLAYRTTPSRFLSPSPGIHTFPMIVPKQVEEEMIIMGGLFFTDVDTRVVDG